MVTGRVFLGVMSVLLLLTATACATPQASRPQTSASAVSSDPVDLSQIRDLDKLVDGRLFQEAELPFPAKAAKPDDQIVRISRRLQHACNANIPTDRRIVTYASEKWLLADRDAVVDQTTFAYDKLVADEAVKEARAALTCTSYAALDRVFEQVGLVQAADEQALSFCEWVRPEDSRSSGAAKPAWLCTLILGKDNLACSVRSWAQEKTTALSIIQSLGPIASRSCRQ